eukprot:12924719-Ditylum_brightwellii.AAC.1
MRAYDCPQAIGLAQNVVLMSLRQEMSASSAMHRVRWMVLLQSLEMMEGPIDFRPAGPCHSCVVEGS